MSQSTIKSPVLTGKKITTPHQEVEAKKSDASKRQELLHKVLTTASGKALGNRFTRLARDGSPLKMGSFGSFGIVPDRVRTVLRYGLNETNVMASGSVQYVFQTGLFDLEVAVGGIQPNGFDQWMAFYSHYLTRAWRFKLTAVKENNDNNPFLIGGAPSLAAGTPTNIASLLGFPHSQWDATGSNGQGAPAVKIETPWMQVHDWVGLTVEEMRAEKDFWGTSSANPPQVLYYHVLLSNNQGVSADYTFTMQVELDVEFFERVALAPS